MSEILEFYSRQVPVGKVFETPNLFWCNGCKIQETWFTKCIVCDTIQCWVCIPSDKTCNLCYEFFPDKQKWQTTLTNILEIITFVTFVKNAFVLTVDTK